MKKNVISVIISCVLATNAVFGFGWFAKLFENFITTKSIRTVYVGNGISEQHVTIWNSNYEIIDEYVVILEEGV